MLATVEDLGLLICTIVSFNSHYKSLRNICDTNDHGYLPFIVFTIRSFPHSWHITGYV